MDQSRTDIEPSGTNPVLLSPQSGKTGTKINEQNVPIIKKIRLHVLYDDLFICNYFTYYFDYLRLTVVFVNFARRKFFFFF